MRCARLAFVTGAVGFLAYGFGLYVFGFDLLRSIVLAAVASALIAGCVAAGANWPKDKYDQRDATLIMVLVGAVVLVLGAEHALKVLAVQVVVTCLIVTVLARLTVPPDR